MGSDAHLPRGREKREVRPRAGTPDVARNLSLSLQALGIPLRRLPRRSHGQESTTSESPHSDRNHSLADTESAVHREITSADTANDTASEKGDNTVVRTGSNRLNIRRLGRSSLVGATASILSQLFLTPFIIRTAGLETYGTFAVLSTYLAFGAFLDFGLRAELTSRVAAARGRQDWPRISTQVSQATGLLFFVGLTVLVLGSAIAPIIAPFAVPGSSSTPLLIALLALTAVGFIFDSRVAALNGLQRGDVLQYAGVISILVRVLATVALLAVYRSVWSLFFAQVAASATVWMIISFKLRQVAPMLRLRLMRVEWVVARGMWGGSALLALSQVSDLVDYNIDRLLIAHFRGVSDAAQFTVGAQLPISLRSFALIPTGVLLAGIAEFTAADDRRRSDALLDGVTRLVLGAGLVIFVGILGLAPSFYKLYLGSGYDLTATVAQLLALATFLNLCSAGWSIYAVAHGWYRVVGRAAACNVVVNGVTSFILILHFGSVGATVGSIVGNVVGLAVLYEGVRSKERRSWFRPVIVPLLGAGILGAPAFFYAQHSSGSAWLSFFLGGCVILFICSASMFLVRYLTPSLIRSLISGVRPE